MTLESKCEELSAQIERLTTEKKTADEKIKCLEDQVKSYYPAFILTFTTAHCLRSESLLQIHFFKT